MSNYLYPEKCCRCGIIFRAAERSAFCPSCVKAIRESNDTAAEYRRRIDAGDVNVTPETEADARKVRDVIQARLRDSGSTPDCRRMGQR